MKNGWKFLNARNAFSDASETVKPQNQVQKPSLVVATDQMPDDT